MSAHVVLYTVAHHSHEFDCPHCGAPVYVGDTAYMVNDDAPYCSRRCADTHGEREARVAALRADFARARRADRVVD